MRLPALLLFLCLVALPPSGVQAADKPPSSLPETAAERLRKALDKVVDLEIAAPSLDTAVNQLREQTGINFVLDPAIAANFVPSVAVGQGDGPPSVRGQLHDMPVRTALTKLFQTHHLTHALVGDTVFITTPEKAIERQLQQSVSVNAEGTPMADVLKRLARETGANIVLDPRSAKEGQTALTLRLDEAPLETAVELLADEAELRAVRLNNVLYVTSEARAEKLRKSRSAPDATVKGWQVWPDGKGGFRLMPPAGVAGQLGGGGINGLAGGAGIAGCFAGIGGLGGNFQGFQQLGVGSGIAGMKPPVPLTPPLPKTKQPVPDKPNVEPKPPAEPALKPAEKDKPTPKDKTETQALGPRTPTPRSRRGV
jgi:hypothetical protein